MAASGVTVFEQNKEQLPQPKPPKDKVLLDERGLLDLPFLALTVLLVLIGVIGSAFWHPFFWLSAFVGAGLVFAGISGFCGLGVLLSHMPWNRR